MEFVISYEKVHHQLLLNQISNTILFYNRDHPEAILVTHFVWLFQVYIYDQLICFVWLLISWGVMLTLQGEGLDLKDINAYP